jgi:DNA-binding transcriptional regulator YiaG
MTPGLKAFRARFGLSQARAADIFCVTRQCWINWEMGHKPMQGPALVLLWLLNRRPELMEEMV